MISFEFTHGLMAPILTCDNCDRRIQGTEGIIGCADHDKTKAIFLHKGRCDRQWSEVHGEMIYWQECEEFILHLAFNAAPPVKDTLESLPLPVNNSHAEWRELRPRISPLVFRRDGHKCVYCGSVERLTVDHIQPQSKGGDHHISNLTTACRDCNSKKNAKTPEEWKKNGLD